MAAIKFSKSFGAHVTALSRTEAKRDECLAIGDDAFAACLISCPEEIIKYSGQFDLIIDTSPKNADVGPFIDMLRFNGTYCCVGIPQFYFAYIPLIFTPKRKSPA